MNKAELIEALADKTGLQKQEAKKVLDAYIEIVTERMSENEEIVLVGFGTLIPRSYVPQRRDRIDRFRNIDTTSSDRAFSS